ncbi:hypothetical protein S40293_00902 [Stachybotrys chartarum IBT 40293]|nr:hypothetical protein S40293_00902 [Stachybotrys chartarum IBT 40293]
MAEQELADVPRPATGSSASDDSSPSELPPLSSDDFKAYNAMAARMDMFHNHFRAMWNELWKTATTGERPRGKSLTRFLDDGIHFTEALEMHHNIEETLLFPQLAKRMVEFSHDNGELVAQHKVIHRGLEGLQAYLKGCRKGKIDFEAKVLKQKMESWGEVLWTHMDDEVKTLGANNVSKYWSKAEFSRIII